MNTKETQQFMESNYYTVTTTFGNIKFKYLLTK